MDTLSAAEVAQQLNTSVPRVQRAVKRLGLQDGGRSGGRLKLTKQDFELLLSELGATPTIPGYSRVEVKVLGALAFSPLGVISIRNLARRAGVSPTAAGHAVDVLEEQGLVIREPHMVALGRAREVEVIRANVLSPKWSLLAPALSGVVQPRRRDVLHYKRVPSSLRHLFWNTAESQLDVASHGNYIARRLITNGDLDGLAWGVTNLTAANWRHAARARGLAPDMKALAQSLASIKEDEE